MSREKESEEFSELKEGGKIHRQYRHRSEVHLIEILSATDEDYQRPEVRLDKAQHTSLLVTGAIVTGGGGCREDIRMGSIVVMVDIPCLC